MAFSGWTDAFSRFFLYLKFVMREMIRKKITPTASAAGALCLRQQRRDNLRVESSLSQLVQDFVLVVGAEGFHRDLELDGGLTVDRHELVVFKADDVAAGFGDDRRDAGQFARTVRQQDGDSEDAVAQD